MNTYDDPTRTQEGFDPELRRPLRNAVRPLRCVFWGALLCVLDITIDGFDLLPDTLGLVILGFGIVPLLPFADNPSYKTPMYFVVVVYVVSLLDTVRATLSLQVPAGYDVFERLLSLAEPAAVVIFVGCMRKLCAWHRRILAEASWRKTEKLWLWIYLVPLATITLLDIAYRINGESFRVDLGPAALLLIPVFLAPLVHFFMSTSRMSAAASARVRRPTSNDGGSTSHE